MNKDTKAELRLNKNTCLMFPEHVNEHILPHRRYTYAMYKLLSESVDEIDVFTLSENRHFTSSILLVFFANATSPLFTLLFFVLFVAER